MMRVLIFTCYKNLENFQTRVDNRTLLWGLDQANIDWELAHPWKPLPDLSRFDAVFSTLYAPYFQNFIFHCRKAEEQCRKAGLPVLNSAEAFNPAHSFFLRRWKEEGVGCAKFEHFTDFSTVTLGYPLILRTDGIHRGQSMYFVNNREEAQQAIDHQYALFLKNYPSREAPEPLNIAIEFVNTVNADGFYVKKRCYVVGDKIIAAHYLRSVNRFVNYKDSLLDPATCAADQQYTLQDEFTDDRELILEAAKATGFDIITLDYSIRPDGTYVFWEGNRMRGTAGDPRIKWLGIRPPDMLYGNAVAELVKTKVAEAQPVHN